MTNSEAASATINAMRETGLIESSDEALVTSVASLAAAVDSDPGNASMWAQYLKALSDLRELSDGGVDSFEELVSWLRTPIRDGENTDP